MSLRLDEDFAAFLSEIRGLLRTEKVYLVGGAVRDLLLGTPAHDLDFVLAKDSVRLAKAVKKHFRGVWYTLDDEHQTARVILDQGSEDERVLDFTSFIGGTIEEDLSQRDFTINAMAIDLDSIGELIDPLGGRKDLFDKQLRLGNPNSLISDPLRVLRGVRMVRTHELEASPELTEAMRVATNGLGRVSGERIRDELLKCLKLPNLVKTFDSLNRFGIYPYLFQRANAIISEGDDQVSIYEEQAGQIEGQETQKNEFQINGEFLSNRAEIIFSLDILLTEIQNNSLPKQLAGIELKVQDLNLILQNLRITLSEELQGSRKRSEALILIAFLAESFDDIEFGENLTDFLMLGQKEKKAIEKICLGYRNIAVLSSKNEIKPLDLYRLFRDSGTYAVESALLHLCQENSGYETRKEAALKALACWFEDQESIVDPPRLIDGNQLKEELGIAPGPWMGEYLEAIREAQVTGEVKSYQDAIKCVKRMIKDRSRDESKN